MKRGPSTRSSRGLTHGFTIVETMVGLIILMVGIMGFAGMILMQAQGNRVAKGLDEAATLVQSQVESLNSITFANLGNDASLQNPELNGLTAAQVWTEGPLNRRAQTVGGGSTGPFSYYRNTVVCSSSTSATAAGSTPKYCASSLGGNNRPTELACNGITPALTSREKMIRVLVSWTDRGGQCHYKRTDALAFSW